MDMTLNKWFFVCGKADSGKTYWIREHIRQLDPKKLYIYDFNCSDYQEFKKANLWNVEYGTPEEAAEFMLESYKAGNNLTVLEEADNYLASKHPDIVRFVNTARNRGVGCCVSAKRAKAVPPPYRTRFNYLIMFKDTLPDDIEYLEEWVGLAKAGKRFVIDGWSSFEEVRSLGQGEHIIVDLDEQTISQKLRL